MREPKTQQSAFGKDPRFHNRGARVRWARLHQKQATPHLTYDEAARKRRDDEHGAWKNRVQESRSLVEALLTTTQSHFGCRRAPSGHAGRRSLMPVGNVFSTSPLRRAENVQWANLAAAAVAVSVSRGQRRKGKPLCFQAS